MTDLLEMCNKVACNLSGKAVVVRFQVPAYKGLLGCTHKDAKGRIIIDIDPKLPMPNFFHVFLHEVAHARFHANEYAKSNISVKGSGTLRNNGKVDQADELQAEALAKYWNEWSDENWGRFHVSGMSKYESKLNALTHYERRGK